MSKDGSINENLTIQDQSRVRGPTDRGVGLSFDSIPLSKDAQSFKGTSWTGSPQPRDFSSIFSTGYSKALESTSQLDRPKSQSTSFKDPNKQPSSMQNDEPVAAKYATRIETMTSSGGHLAAQVIGHAPMVDKDSRNTFYFDFEEPLSKDSKFRFGFDGAGDELPRSSRSRKPSFKNMSSFTSTSKEQHDPGDQAPNKGTTPAPATDSSKVFSDRVTRIVFKAGKKSTSAVVSQTKFQRAMRASDTSANDLDGTSIVRTKNVRIRSRPHTSPPHDDSGVNKHEIAPGMFASKTPILPEKRNRSKARQEYQYNLTHRLVPNAASDGVTKHEIRLDVMVTKASAPFRDPNGRKKRKIEDSNDHPNDRHAIVSRSNTKGKLSNSGAIIERPHGAGHLNSLTNLGLTESKTAIGGKTLTGMGSTLMGKSAGSSVLPRGRSSSPNQAQRARSDSLSSAANSEASGNSVRKKPRLSNRAMSERELKGLFEPHRASMEVDGSLGASFRETSRSSRNTSLNREPKSRHPTKLKEARAVHKFHVGSSPSLREETKNWKNTNTLSLAQPNHEKPADIKEDQEKTAKTKPLLPNIQRSRSYSQTSQGSKAPTPRQESFPTPSLALAPTPLPATTTADEKKVTGIRVSEGASESIFPSFMQPGKGYKDDRQVISSTTESSIIVNPLPSPKSVPGTETSSAQPKAKSRRAGTTESQTSAGTSSRLWKPNDLCKDSVLTYATTADWEGLSVDQVSKNVVRKVKAEREGVFRASGVLMGVRFVVGV